MVIASILEPKKARVGDYWFCLATKTIYEAVGVLSSAVTWPWQWLSIPQGVFDAPSPPSITPTSIIMPALWVNSNDPDRIPHVLDMTSYQWIPVVPIGYIFPPQRPQIGDCWRDSMSGFDFLYNAGGWMILPVPFGGPGALAGAGAPIPQRTYVCPSCFGTNTISSGRCNICGAYAPGASPVSSPPVPQVSPHLTGGLNVNNVSSGGMGHLTFNPVSSNPMLTLSPNQSALNIANLVEIFADGRIVYDISYTPDKAAEALWEAIAQMSPIYKENEKIKILETSNEYLEKIIQMYKDAGCKLPGPVRAPDPTAAWNAAMGVII